MFSGRRTNAATIIQLHSEGMTERAGASDRHLQGLRRQASMSVWNCQRCEGATKELMGFRKEPVYRLVIPSHSVPAGMLEQIH